MRKILFTLMIMMGIVATANARDTFAHDGSVLPKAAQTLIAKNFKAQVSVVKIEKTLNYIKEYEVVLTDGSEISFDRKGNWEKVEVNRAGAVPAGFIPKAMSDYVNKNHPGKRIVGIEKERHGYEVELSDGVDIKFNSNGSFQRYD